MRVLDPVVLSFLLASALSTGSGVTAGPGNELPQGAPGPSTERNPRWAVRVERTGVPNLHRVSPTLYRGAQPTREGLDELRRLGVRTILSLRAFHGERESVAAAGLGYERVSFKVWHPEDEDMRRFLAIVGDPARQPVFVHCLRGSDRTGTAVAVYRMCTEGWSREDAIDEMVRGGFGFHRRFSHLEKYLRTLDVAALSGRSDPESAHAVPEAP